MDTINDFAKGKVYCVVGCGGDRDHDKRPKMAQIAVTNSDLAVFTSDNPRTEDPQAIIDDMLKGVEAGTAKVIVDRSQAIRWALEQAQPGDVVLIAGKGHEDYQIIGKQKYHFDDVEEVTNYFKQA